MKKREANFELLRIAAMLMIITLHYLDKGGILPRPTDALTPAGSIAWLLEAFCVCSVNVYVLVSAYFLVKSGYRPIKALELWAQVFFYSVGIAVFLTALGIVPVSDWNLYQTMNYLFPVIEEHYWFVTAYILMILFAPLMNEGLAKLPKKTYQTGIVLLLVLLSISKTILPVTLPTDRLGYDTVWFLALYLIGAYIRLYGVRMERKIAFLGYVCCSLMIFGSLVFMNAVYRRYGKLPDFINRQYQYNSLFCLLSAVFLFFIFKNVAITGEKAAQRICSIAGASFGVYLIHEHINLRYLWTKWLHVKDFGNTPLFPAHWLVSIVIVYAVCMLIDRIRQYIFCLGRKILENLSV